LLESTRLLTVVTILSAGFALPARAEYQLLDSTDLSEANAEDSMSLLSLLTETKKNPNEFHFEKEANTIQEKLQNGLRLRRVFDLSENRQWSTMCPSVSKENSKRAQISPCRKRTNKEEKESSFCESSTLPVIYTGR